VKVTHDVITKIIEAAVEYGSSGQDIVGDHIPLSYV